MKTLVLSEYGGYLGTEKFDFVVKKGEEKLIAKPFHSVKEMILSSGNSISTKALAWASIYGIKTLVTSQSGRLLGVLLPLSYDSHVKTRIKQYEAHSNKVGVHIAKTIAKSKIEAQASLLEKHEIDCDKCKNRSLDKLEKLEANSVDQIRTKIHSIEGHFGKFYFKELIKLFPENLQTRFRHAYKAVDITNNLFNLGYEVLKWEVYKSVISAHLDPFLGFLHSIQHSKPSLVCDLQEPYRPLIDDFLVKYCKQLDKKDFEVNFRGKNPRIFLENKKSSKFIDELNSILNTKIKKQRINNFRIKLKKKTIMKQDIAQLASYFNGKITAWKPTNLLQNQN